LTTIAYSEKHNQIACDSRTTEGNAILNEHAQKWFVLACGSKVFCSGATLDIEQLKKRLQHGELFSNIGLVKFIRVGSKGVFYGEANNDHIKEEPLNHDHAIGSGAPYAQAAMERGDIAQQAVECAARRDSKTNNIIHVFNTLPSDWPYSELHALADQFDELAKQVSALDKRLTVSELSSLQSRFANLSNTVKNMRAMLHFPATNQLARLSLGYSELDALESYFKENEVSYRLISNPPSILDNLDVQIQFR